MTKERELKKKILFVEQNQDGTVGGSHYSLLNLIKCLDRKSFSPMVMFYEENAIIDKFASYCTPILFRKPLGKYFRPPNSALQIPFKIFQKGYNFLFVSVIPLIKMSRFVYKNRIDLVHLNNSAHSGWGWLFVTKLLGKKCITHQRGFARFKWPARKVAKCFDRIICVSDAILEYLRKYEISDNTLTLYNVIDVEEFRLRINRNPQNVREEFGVGDSEILIGIVGNFQEWKGQRTVITAVEILRRKHQNLRCLLIGDVSVNNQKDMVFFQEVKEEIRRKNLEKDIILTGYRSDIPDLMNALDIVIHASSEPEPFGRVILEGMGLEKPVIATDIGGPREIIENGISGFLIPPRKPDILAEKIEFLLEHPDIRKAIGIKAAKRVLEQFGLEAFALRINGLYDKLLSNHREG